MIKATLWRSENNVYVGYEISGHAGYADHGMDIICSAVSVLAINTANSIDTFTKLSPVVSESDGHLLVQFTDLPKVSDADQDKIELLMQSFKLGLDSIESSYGSKYLQVKTIHK